MDGIDLNQLKIAVGVLFSIATIAIVASGRIAEKVEKAVIRWIKAIRHIREEWHKPLIIEKTSEPLQPFKKTRSRRELGSGGP